VKSFHSEIGTLTFCESQLQKLFWLFSKYKQTSCYKISQHIWQHP